jgi:hypothetical protein
MSISLGVARRWQTLTHIAASARVAPLLLLFAGKLAIWLGRRTVAPSLGLKPLLEPFIEPARPPLWQIGSAASALPAIGLYLLPVWHLKQIEADRPNPSSEQMIKRRIGAITVIRNTPPSTPSPVRSISPGKSPQASNGPCSNSSCSPGPSGGDAPERCLGIERQAALARRKALPFASNR